MSTCFSYMGIMVFLPKNIKQYRLVRKTTVLASMLLLYLTGKHRQWANSGHSKKTLFNIKEDICRFLKTKKSYRKY